MSSIEYINFNYCGGCDINYHTYRACENGSDCCDNDYCRCGEIQETIIRQPPELQYVVDVVAESFSLTDELDLYACDRILRHLKAYEPYFYYVRVCNGYYGQEIDGVYFSNPQKIKSIFNEYLKLTTIEQKVEFLLILEYGYILESLKGKKYTIKDVNHKSIIFPNEDYHTKVSIDNVDYSYYLYPKCVCLYYNSKYKLIDGYHRMSANKNDIVRIIVGE